MKTLATLFLLLALTLGAHGASSQPRSGGYEVVKSYGGTATNTSLLGTNTIDLLFASNVVNYSRGSWYFNSNSNIQWRLAWQKTLTGQVDCSAAMYVPEYKLIGTCHNNNNGRITFWTMEGAAVSTFDWTASQVPDAEEVIYLGNNLFAEVDEDSNRIFLFSITNIFAGGTLNTNNTRIIQLATSIGNDPGSGSGVEGLALSRRRNCWFVAREKSPAQLLSVSLDGATTNLFLPLAVMQGITNASRSDISSLWYSEEDDVLLIATDEGGTQTDSIIILDMSKTNIVGVISCTNFGQLEGVCMADGNIIAIGEANQIACFVPERGGLNSGINWKPAPGSTNTPAVPYLPFGFSVGPNGVLVTNVATTNIALTFPQVNPLSSTGLAVALAGIAAGDLCFVSSTQFQTGLTYDVVASNGVAHVRAINASSNAITPIASSVYSVIGFKIR